MKKVELDGGNIVLYQGDSLDVLNTLEKNSVEIAVTSPPYNLCKRYTNYDNTVIFKPNFNNDTKSDNIPYYVSELTSEDEVDIKTPSMINNFFIVS